MIINQIKQEFTPITITFDKHWEALALFDLIDMLDTVYRPKLTDEQRQLIVELSNIRTLGKVKL